MISGNPQPTFSAVAVLASHAAHRSLSIVCLCLAALCLASCASPKLDYTPKTAQQQEQDAVEHRVFYEGWFTR